MQRVEEEARTVVAEVMGALLDTRVEEVLGRGWREGVASSELGEEGEVECRRCGARARGMFWRNGHRGRTLMTPRGEVRVGVPMLECRCCAGAGRWDHGYWERFARLVGGWEQLVARWVQQGSVRAMGQWLGQEMGVRVSASALGERLGQAEGAYERWRREPLGQVPPVLVVDGLHFTVGKGPGRQGHKACAVVAIGLWPEQARAQILDFELGEKEDEATCRRLFDRLYERGLEGPALVVSDDNAAYRAAAAMVWGPVPWQLCINHKLRAARRHAPAGMKKRFMAEAREIFEAESFEQARSRAQAFARRWREKARGAVQSLMRNLDLALTFHLFPGGWRAGIRTNNAAESAMRCLRDALRRAGGCTGSPKGTLARLFAAALAFNHSPYP